MFWCGSGTEVRLKLICPSPILFENTFKVGEQSQQLVHHQLALASRDSAEPRQVALQRFCEGIILEWTNQKMIQTFDCQSALHQHSEYADAVTSHAASEGLLMFRRIGEKSLKMTSAEVKEHYEEGEYRPKETPERHMAD